MQRRKGFTLIELLVVISIIALLIGILLPALGAARRTARQLTNSTQLRGIQQGMVTFAASNKRGGQDGFFPGLDSSGDVASTPEAVVNEDYGATGTEDEALLEPRSIYSIMLNDNIFVPEYVINPADSDVSEAGLQAEADGGTDGEVDVDNFSYALLSLGDNANAEVGMAIPDDIANGRAQEWSETLNTSAVIITDKNTGNDAVVGGDGEISSVWTEIDTGDWRGTITRNDNSTSFENSPVVEQTRYGNNASITMDNIFSVTGGGDGNDGNDETEGNADAENSAAMIIDGEATGAERFVNQGE